MMKTAGRILLGGAVALLVASAAPAQQVTIGPIAASGAAGSEVDFNITYNGPTNANGISFNMIYGATQSAAFVPTGSTISCTKASDLDPNITVSAVNLASQGKIAFTVIGLSLSTGPVAFGRTGVLGSCKFMITGAASGTIPLPCDTTAGATTASDVTGADLTASCVDGTLTVGGGGNPTPTATAGSTQVTIGPITATGAAGSQVDFNITYNGPTNANGISFNMIYGSTQSAAFVPTGSSITCTRASDLDPNITVSAVTLASQGKIAFTVIGLSLSTGPVAFGRTGVLGSCKFMITSGATGTIPLPCDNSAGATTASDVTGADLTASCVDGTLTVSGGGGGTATPTQTAPPATGVSTPTRTPTTPPTTGVNTPTRTPTSTVSVPSPGTGTPGFEDEDGCQINTRSSANAASWLWLAPVVGVLLLRRRRR